MTHILTLVADRRATTLSQAIANRVAEAIGAAAPVWLSPGEAADLATDEPPDLEVARAALANAPIDAIPVRRRGRRKAVLVADMDSTIVTGETLDELAAWAGVGEVVAAITRRSMNGELDFAAALRERVAMLRGQRLDILVRTLEGVRLTDGARTLVSTMRAHHATTALVTGGFSYFASRIAEQVGFDLHRANTLEDDGTVLTGTLAEPILDQGAKLATLQAIAEARRARLRATLAVGDGANDLGMLRAAGLGIAFHAKPVVTAEIAARVDHADLRALLFVQGYPASAFVTT